MNQTSDRGNKLTITLILLTLTVYSQQLTVDQESSGYYRAGFVGELGRPVRAQFRESADQTSLPRSFQVGSLHPEILPDASQVDFENFDGEIPTPVLTLLGTADSSPAGQADVLSLMEQYLAMDEEAFELDPEDIPIPELVEDSGGGQEFTFTTVQVRSGQTLELVAAGHSVDARHLALVNGLDSRSLKAGQELIVPLGLGTLHKVGRGETLWSIGKNYNLKMATLLYFNRKKQTDSVLSPDEELYIPLGIINTTDATLIAANPKIRQMLDQGTLFAWPVHGRLSSRFGWRKDPILHTTRMHRGIDLACPYGSSIKAIERGRVVYTGWRGAAGITVIVEHPNGMHSIYAHCSKALVKPGQWVSKRHAIARVGSTGRATGAHLHFALKRKNGEVVNPLKFLNLASL